jgi:hypothetical protein
MLEFDLSAIDIVLLVAVLILFLLYVSKKPSTSKTESGSELDISRKQEIPSIKKDASRVKKPKTSSSVQLSAESLNCAHEFGYLKDLPRNTPVPDECFGCPKVMQCLFPKE